MELNKVLIGMSLVIVMLFGFLFFITEGVTQYNPSQIPTDYNTTFYDLRTDLASLEENANETDTGLNAISGDSNFVADFIGFFFGQGYKAIKTFVTGLNLLNAVKDEVIDNTLGSSDLGSILKSQIIVIILIIVVSLLLHFIIKSDRI
jgi:hypothetical protein